MNSVLRAVQRVFKSHKTHVNVRCERRQTHSLSMEKQVTGPSAAQVAVLKTSLPEEEQCTRQARKSCNRTVIYMNKLLQIMADDLFMYTFPAHE